MFSGGNQDEITIAQVAVCPGLQQNIHSFYQLDWSIFSGKTQVDWTKNAHDFPTFVGQKVVLSESTPLICFPDAAKGLSCCKGNRRGVIEFMTDGSAIELRWWWKNGICPASISADAAWSSYAGIDIYVKNQEGYFWKGNFTPTGWFGAEMRYTVRLCEDKEKKMHQVML